MKIFIDSSFLISLANENDSLHEKSLQYLDLVQEIRLCLAYQQNSFHSALIPVWLEASFPDSESSFPLSRITMLSVRLP